MGWQVFGCFEKKIRSQETGNLRGRFCPWIGIRSKVIGELKRKRLPTDFHGLARIFGCGVTGGCVKFFGYWGVGVSAIWGWRARFPLIENGLARMEEYWDWRGRFCPRIFTDWHGFLDVGLTGGCVELFGYWGVGVSGYMRRKNEERGARWLKTDWHGLKTGDRSRGRRIFAHGLARIFTAAVDLLRLCLWKLTANLLLGDVIRGRLLGDVVLQLNLNG